jgi:hypothetical protein
MTKPTRQQDQACDRLADSLVRITSAARLDGKASFQACDLLELFKRISRCSSAFPPEEILLRALDRRARELSLRSGTGELLMLVAGDGPAALDLLLLDDPTFQSRAAKADEELG